ncbi:hypothetical protein F3Y22_tig00111392pilonHSYRG00104 [Hibiscus syriacus]|uniref:PGG domain-containing protein n=1 Tax=Hibiscus syriacus TaxID=106335 RepID=A0A6A2XWK7_HIBSY|nr:hypothetical protein F3Y22_tig00111392pilonHSYRG00104 [Hibiscus syriacus]
MDAAMYEAAERGDIEVFHSRARFELEPLRTNTEGQTLLHVAARHGHSAVVKFLIDFQAGTARLDLEEQETGGDAERRMLRKTDHESNTPLHIAVHGRVVKMGQICCLYCCEKVDKIGWNLLHFVALRNSPFYLCRSLFKYGIVASQCRSVGNLIDAKDVHGITPQQVYDASSFNVFDGWKIYSYKPIKNMWQRQVRSIAVRNVSSYTAALSSDNHPVDVDAALYDAAERGDIDVFHRNRARFELEPLRTNCKGQTLLHVAARHGHSTVVEFLIKFQAETAHGDVEQQGTGEDAVRRMLREMDNEFNTALHIAVQYGHLGVERRWAPAGYDFTKLKSVAHDGPRGRTALHAAAMAGDAGGNLTKERDVDGHTPLHYAAHLGHSRVVEELLKWDKSAAYDGIDAPQNQSVENLIGAKDVHGITPQQVYCASFNAFVASMSSKPSKNIEQIVKLLEHIGNEVVAEAPVCPIDLPGDNRDLFEKVREGHLIVAALIATVTFAAAMTVPGGYKSEQGKEQGTPFLIHDAAFKAFVVSDALALIFSLSAVVVHLDVFIPFPNQRNPSSLSLAGLLLYNAMAAIMVAFSTGTYVVLKPSPGLAITSCCNGLLSSSFLYLKQLESMATESMVTESRAAELTRGVIRYLTKEMRKIVGRQ